MREEFSGTRAKGVAVGPFAPFLRLTFNPLIGINIARLDRNKKDEFIFAEF